MQSPIRTCHITLTDICTHSAIVDPVKRLAEQGHKIDTLVLDDQIFDTYMTPEADDVWLQASHVLVKFGVRQVCKASSFASLRQLDTPDELAETIQRHITKER